ncbi:hypothetical protein TNIN_351641 [Trichonephila inaurata madagascariensis]|uniref:Uncharacterized protein n=1 Tax=Trichonephila inaurata madagascariensis TaxID=2747483 RepID=A0A8X6MH73_9ARAC|nr:hypothetical protein TNIN_351641 [Trichonephila inaurata madagascariensis]
MEKNEWYLLRRTTLGVSLSIDLIPFPSSLPPLHYRLPKQGGDRSLIREFRRCSIRRKWINAKRKALYTSLMYGNDSLPLLFLQ